MSFRIRKPSVSFLLIALLAALLAALAWLQYRWIGEVSSAEQERMRAHARVAAENFSRDFDREITRVFLELQIDPISYERKTLDNYASRYERWQSATPFPKLVSKVFLAAKDERGSVRLSVYNETSKHFEESGWSPEFQALQNQLEWGLSDHDSVNKEKIFPPPIIATPELAALVIPISMINLLNLNRIQAADEGNRIQSGEAIKQVGYTIILLDFDYIKNELLPLLVIRHFNSADDSERYNVIISNRDQPAQIIYQSEPPQNGHTEEGIESDFFGLRLNEIDNLLPARSRQAQLPEINSGGRKKPRFSVSILPSNKDSATVNIASFGSFNAQWRLMAKHRNDSLGLTVNAARRRNLLISFGILLLLAVSGIMIVILSSRTRSFARQQADFVASVTHELRTPLAAIRSMSENLADGIVTDREKIKQYGILINDEEHRLSAMIEQMLGHTGAQGVQNGHIELYPQSVSSIIETALEDYRAELVRREFHIELIVQPDLPSIRGDAEALRRAVGNLIGNAMKYSDEKRRIEIKAHAAVDEKNIKFVEISIKDAGIGIDSADLPNVFKLFYRGRAAIQKQIEGSGIGLSVVKQIVEAHRGTITASSKTGRGSNFTMRLPAISRSTNLVESHPTRKL